LATELLSAVWRSEPTLIALSSEMLGLKGSSVGVRRTTSALATYVSAVLIPSQAPPSRPTPMPPAISRR
jgi:hypothetical protein